MLLIYSFWSIYLNRTYSYHMVSHRTLSATTAFLHSLEKIEINILKKFTTRLDELSWNKLGLDEHYILKKDIKQNCQDHGISTTNKIIRQVIALKKGSNCMSYCLHFLDDVDSSKKSKNNLGLESLLCSDLGSETCQSWARACVLRISR